MTRLNSVVDLEKLQRELACKKDPGRRVIAVCAVPGCGAYGSEKVPPALREQLRKRGLEGTVEVIYLDGTIEVCSAGDVCFWPAPHNFKSKSGAAILQFSTAGGLAAQGTRIKEFVMKQMKK